MERSKKLLAIAGRAGILAGILMIIRPDGSLIGMQVSGLSKTLVNNFVLPGVVVGIGYGIIPLLLSSERFYAKKTVLVYALLALCWIIFEAVFFDLFHWLHAAMVFLLVGVIVFLQSPRID